MNDLCMYNIKYFKLNTNRIYMINIIPWLLNLSYHNYDIIFPYIIILKYRYAAKIIIISYFK